MPYMDLAIMFNSIYAIADKDKLLSSLDKISKPGAILVVFDYSVLNQDESLLILDFAGKEMLPIELNSFSKALERNNWQMMEAQDLSSQFIIWYSDFLKVLQNNENNLARNFAQKDIEQVGSSFTYFLEQLKAKKMGGIVIYAIKK